MADSRQQVPFINPLVPFTGPICGDLCDGMMVIVSGTVSQNCDRFRINFESVSCQNSQDDIAFRFNPRFEEGGYVVCNTFENQSWGKEEKKCLFQKVTVNGNDFLEYKYRIPVCKVNAIGVAGGVEVSDISFQKAAPAVMFPPGPYQMQPYPMPYRTSMAGGLYPLKSVVITGTVLPKADRFHVNLKRDEDVAFHLNPRFSETTIVRNKELARGWAVESVFGSDGW